MRVGALGLLAIAGIVRGQVPDPQHYVEIKIPRGVDSATVFIRYVLDGGFGGWVDPRAEVSAYFIATTRNGRASSRLKALIYSPGCAIQTQDLTISRSGMQQLLFECEPVYSNWISGFVSGLRDARVQVKYSARWVQEFLALSDRIVTFVPVAEANYYSDEGRFRVSIPDFPKGDRSGEIQFWAADPASGKVLARLTPAVPLAPGSALPSEIKFEVCGSNVSGSHDAFGFALRAPESSSACRP